MVSWHPFIQSTWQSCYQSYSRTLAQRLHTLVPKPSSEVLSLLATMFKYIILLHNIQPTDNTQNREWIYSNRKATCCLCHTKCSSVFSFTQTYCRTAASSSSPRPWNATQKWLVRVSDPPAGYRKSSRSQCPCWHNCFSQVLSTCCSHRFKLWTI